MPLAALVVMAERVVSEVMAVPVATKAQAGRVRSVATADLVAQAVLVVRVAPVVLGPSGWFATAG